MPCPCSSLDWSDIITDCFRRGVPTPEHHDDCTAGVNWYWFDNHHSFDALRDLLASTPLPSKNNPIAWEATPEEIQAVLDELYRW